jgi:hypothetical protein
VAAWVLALIPVARRVPDPARAVALLLTPPAFEV